MQIGRTKEFLSRAYFKKTHKGHDYAQIIPIVVANCSVISGNIGAVGAVRHIVSLL